MKYQRYLIIFLITANFASGYLQEGYAEDLPIKPGGIQLEPQKEIIPDHEIKYEETLSPDWKENWDLARSLYREKKYPEALVQYEILFTQKENIDEARWEYVSILMYLERWEDARSELEKLLATDPESFRYRLAMAGVSLETGNTENGIALYKQLLGKSISDADKITVLQGLIRAYEQQGQEKALVPLLGQLVALKPQDSSLALKLAAHELVRGNVARAKELCVELEESYSQDVSVLSMRALIEERLNNNDQAAAYWQKVIGIDPENLSAHDHLYVYYFENENWAMSFNHLEQLIKMSPNSVDLLLQAAELGKKQGRIDRALEYYEFGLAVDPLNKSILEGKRDAQKVFARELLELVENDTEKKLWQDIVKVVPDSVGVYREIANLLRQQGKVVELTEVLRLLNRQVPDDQHIHNELASLLQQQGLVEELAALESDLSDVNQKESQ